MNVINSEIIHSTLLNSFPFLLLSLPFIISYILIHVIGRKKPKFFDSLFILGIPISVIFVLSITILPDFNVGMFDLKNMNQFNLNPFQSISQYYMLSTGGELGAILNLYGNIAIFIPTGFFIASRLKNSPIIKSVLITVLVSVSIELCQSSFSRFGDIDDIILNTIGGLLGSLLFSYLDGKRKKGSTYKKQKKGDKIVLSKYRRK